MELEQRDFIRAGLEYVCLIQEVQERKKFEFVETVRKSSLSSADKNVFENTLTYIFSCWASCIVG